MSYPLSKLVMRFQADPRRMRDEFKCPFLIWEAPNISDSEEHWMATRTGEQKVDPRMNETLVFPLVKGNSRANAFVMGITVGRTENNDVVISDQSVSRFHAYFQQDPKSEAWKLTDAESKNGTFVAGARLFPKNALALDNGARLRFGEVEVRFLIPDAFFAYLSEQVR